MSRLDDGREDDEDDDEPGDTPWSPNIPISIWLPDAGEEWIESGREDARLTGEG